MTTDYTYHKMGPKELGSRMGKSVRRSLLHSKMSDPVYLEKRPLSIMGLCMLIAYTYVGFKEMPSASDY